MLNHSKTERFHLWVPNIFGFKGGVQVYSGFFLEALQSLYPYSEIDVFLKHDQKANLSATNSSQTRFHFAGNYPLKIRTPIFAAQLLSQGILQRPALVIATHLNFTIAAYHLKRLTGIPYWAIAHGVEAWNIQKPALRFALQAADRILCVSHYTRDRLLTEQDLDPQRVVVLPNTFDADRFQIREKPNHLLKKHGLKPEQRIILTVNRLAAKETYRGYDRILEAFPKILEAIPTAHFLIVGKGDDRPRLEQEILRRGLQKHVTLTGFIPDEELCSYYNLCDVFAMPSKLEGFGIVYLEALACGKPTLGGKQDGAIDALCHGKLGALVDPDNPDEIAKTLIDILNGTYSNPLMYQPELIRQEVIKKYGFKQFQKELKLLFQRRFEASYSK